MNNPKTSDTIISDLLRPMSLNKGFIIWMSFLFIAFGICIYAYTIQLREGLGVTGMRDYVSWGMYISNFVFFVASSLIGMLISAVLGLTGAKWITPLTRIAEIISLAFASVAGLVIISDMGRPERLLYVFIHARIQSPILWDVTVVITYTVICALLLYLPLIPDMKICYENKNNIPGIQKRIYKFLSIGWKGSNEQQDIIRHSMKILLILIIPVALAIHTVTSWLFAVTHRVGWDSTIFGPYFVTGAFVAGCAAVIIVMYVVRKNYKLQDYLTDIHFEKMGRLLALVSLVYLYFNLNEYLVPAYKMKKFDVIHLMDEFTGEHAALFWGVQILGLIIPIILLLIKNFRKPLPLFIISIFVLLGAWFKRYLIVIPTMEHPFLPIQYVPQKFKIYTPTLIETAITMASVILVIIIISMLVKIFPVIPVSETIKELEEKETDQQ